MVFADRVCSLEPGSPPNRTDILCRGSPEWTSGQSCLNGSISTLQKQQRIFPQTWQLVGFVLFYDHRRSYGAVRNYSHVKTILTIDGTAF